MSYIQIELGGEKRGLKYNNLAVEVFSKHIAADATNASILYATIYAGLVANAYVKREEFVETFEQITDWVDAAKDEEIKLAADTFAATEVWKKALERFKDTIKSLQTDDKKKVVKKKAKIIAGS